MRDWLQLFRAQTAPATVFAIMIPYFAGGGRDPIVAVLLFGLGHILHYASFGHNSLMDYLMDFDKADPNKQHHPLPAGRISEVKASWVIHVLLFVSLAGLGAIAVWLDRPIALLMLMMYAVWGYAYNNGLDHLSENSWIPISLAFAFLPLYGYLLAGNSWRIAALFWSWGFLTTFYQIDWEGNLKDLWNPMDRAANKLRKKGICDVDDDIVMCLGKRVLEYFIPRELSYIIGLVIGIAIIGTGSLYVFLASLFTLVMIIVAFSLHLSMSVGVKRKKMLEIMGLQEVIVFYALLLILLPKNWVGYSLLALYGISYFVIMNKKLWKSRFGPRV